MKRKSTALCLSLAALLGLGGCTMAPRYARPEPPVPTGWPSGPAYQERSGSQASRAAADLPWQEFFVEEQLQKLIALALANNRDLRCQLLVDGAPLGKGVGHFPEGGLDRFFVAGNSDIPIHLRHLQAGPP